MLSNGDNFTTYPDFMTIRISDDLNAEWANGDYVVNRTSIAFRAVQNPIADFSVIGSTGPNAVECLLQFCVQNFSTSVVNGVAKTTVLQSQTAASLGITFDPTSFRNVEDDSASDSVLSVPYPSGIVNYTYGLVSRAAGLDRTCVAWNRYPKSLHRLLRLC